MTTTYTVNGMTCHNCVAHITEDLMELAGVSDVAVDLVAGGASAVYITSDTALDRTVIAAAVEEAGYELV